MTGTFEFEVAPIYRGFAAAWGVTPGRASVAVTDDEFLVRFGPHCAASSGR